MLVAAGADRDAALGGGADRVADQVVEGLREQPLVAADERVVGVKLELDALLEGQRLEPVVGVGGQIGEVYGVEVHVVGLGARERQQVLGHRLEPGGLAAQPLQRVVAQLPAPRACRVEAGAQRRERRAQLVGCVGQEVVLALTLLPQARREVAEGPGQQRRLVASADRGHLATGRQVADRGREGAQRAQGHAGAEPGQRPSQGCQDEGERHRQPGEGGERLAHAGEGLPHLHGHAVRLVEQRDDAPTRHGPRAPALDQPGRVEGPRAVDHAALPEQLAVEEHLRRTHAGLAGQVALHHRRHADGRLVAQQDGLVDHLGEDRALPVERQVGVADDDPVGDGKAQPDAAEGEQPGRQREPQTQRHGSSGSSPADRSSEPSASPGKR